MQQLFLIRNFRSISAPGFLQSVQKGPAPLDFREEKLEELKKDPAYDYSEFATEENWWTSFKRYLGNQWNEMLEWLLGDLEIPLFFRLIIDLLPYLLIGLLLGLILFLFSRTSYADIFQKHQEETLIYTKEEEKIIRTGNIKDLIEDAIAKRNYRMAVRYHFLFVLQQLSRRNLIVYDNTKTDQEYLQEIQKPEIKNAFKKINYIYEFVWYGDFPPSIQDYKKIKKEFDKVEMQIRT